MPKYHLITFGCQMNKSDSERIVSVLEDKGYRLASRINEADLILVNMCSVRQSAVDRVYGLALKFQKLKTQNPKLKTILTGCILPTDRKKLKNRFDSIANTKDLLEHYHVLMRGTVYIPVSNGCNWNCAYCVVPFTRGPLVCRNHQEILKEVKNAVKTGIKEIWLLGQNVNDYISKQKTKSKKQIINFAKLLKMVNETPGDFQIKFTSPNPANFTDELIDTMAECEKAAHYLNLPVQSGDNQILKKMRRPYTVEQYKDLVRKIRSKIPDINLSTDVIVGFPGETKKQFENTVKLFKEIKFNMAYIAKYSPRPGTSAFQMKDDVPLEEKKRREKILRELIF